MPQRETYTLAVIFAFLGFFFYLSSVHSQSVFSSEDELKKQANNLFDNEEFVKAYPLFSQLLSLYPKDPQYNYKFGTCLLYASGNKEKAIPYLEYAAKRQKQNVDPEVYYYLARAYHLNYRFNEAIRYYNLFKILVPSRKVEKLDVPRQIEMCENGKSLLQNISDLSVLQKKEVPEADFFRSYDLSEFNAKIVIKPDELRTSIDKKKKEESVIYLAPNRNQIYFSSYGEDGKTGRDIYYVTRNPNGDLSKPIKLSDVINTRYDEDYPFLHPNGKILYFCSKGHNSMGGYDIFKSEWNNSTNSWGKPINMDFAINSPDDDILFISDADNKYAFFSSRRESATGNIVVFKIRIQRKPLSQALITGKLTKEFGDKTPNAKITVTKKSSDEVVGVVNTDPANGTYSINLPNGGDYLFTIEGDDFNKVSELVSIPSQQDIKPLKQYITISGENGQSSQMQISNKFESASDSTSEAVALQYIKSKASLDVTSADEETPSASDADTSSDSTSKETKTPASKKKHITPVTNVDIIQMSYQDAKETQKETNDLIRNADAAKLLSNKKNELSVQKNKDAEDMLKAADALTDQQAKMEKIDNATKLRKEGQTLSQESALSLTISNQLTEQARAKQIQADSELKYAKDIESAIKANASEKKMNELLARKEELERQGDSLKTSDAISSTIEKRAQTKQLETKKAQMKYVDLQQDVEDLRSESKRLRDQAQNTKDEGVKLNLLQQAEDLDREYQTKQAEANKLNTKALQLQTQSDSLNETATITSSVMKEIQNLPEVTTAQSTTSAKTGNAKGSSSASGKSTSHSSANSGITTPISQQTISTTSANTSAESSVSQSTTDAGTVSNTPSSQTNSDSNFSKKLQEANTKSTKIEREQTKAVVYQSWADSLDDQIAIMKQQLAATPGEEQKKNILEEIDMTQVLADEKRQKAADSRKNIDYIKLHEALDAASVISPATATTTPTTTVSTTTEDSKINADYENRLKANESIANETERKLKEQGIYKEWSTALTTEAKRLRAEGNTAKAEKLEKESSAKQNLAARVSTNTTANNDNKSNVVASENQKTTTEEKQATPLDNDQNKNTKVNTGTETPSTTLTTTTTASNKTQTTTSSSTYQNNKNNQEQPTETQPDLIPISVPESVKNKEEYSHYVLLKNETIRMNDNISKQNKKADDFQKQADDAFKESGLVSQQMSQTLNINELKRLQEKSDLLDKKALHFQVKADSVRILAKNMEEETSSRQTEADLYLQSLDKDTYEEIATATAKSGEKKTEPTTSANNISPSTETKNSNTNISTQTVTTTGNSTQASDTEILAGNETKESIANNNKNKEQSATGSTQTTTKSSTKTSQDTEPKTSEYSESATGKVKMGKDGLYTPNSYISPKKNTKSPANAGTAKTTPPSSETMRFYNNLIDKIDMSGDPYSVSNPIPLDAPLPDGLVYKVQIGAFKNPIPQNLFKGLNPITAESTPLGLKRYTAGLFRKFENAYNAKLQVNELGYKDAFIVAFFNGKRIQLSEAMAKAKESGEKISNVFASSANPASPENVIESKEPSSNSKSGKQTSSSNQTTAQQADNSISSTTASFGTTPVKATNIKTIQGLLYTIQIGVFSKPVSSAQLYNLSPINSERMDNGLIRYTTGQFTDENKAIEAKNSIVAKGISDAFVIAYNNGVRITIGAAKTTIDSQGKKALAKIKQQTPVIPSDNTPSTKSNQSSSIQTILFKVQVGAYREQVPIQEANELLKIAGRGIKTFTDSNGLLVYTVGEFQDYDSANTLKNQLVNEGITGAFVIAMKDGNKMSVYQAIEMLKSK